MLLAVIDSDRVAKACPREFLRFRLELAKTKLSMPEFALFLDHDLLPVGVDTTDVRQAYQKLILKFKRSKKIKIKLTTKGALNEVGQNQNNFFRRNNSEYYDIRGNPIHAEKFAGCIWLTEVKLPNYHKKIGVELVERR
jgi:hypothetical protein